MIAVAECGSGALSLPSPTAAAAAAASTMAITTTAAAASAAATTTAATAAAPAVAPHVRGRHGARRELPLSAMPHGEALSRMNFLLQVRADNRRCWGPLTLLAPGSPAQAAYLVVQRDPALARLYVATLRAIARRLVLRLYVAAPPAACLHSVGRER